MKFKKILSLSLLLLLLLLLLLILVSLNLTNELIFTIYMKC